MFNYYQSHSLIKLAEHFSNNFVPEKENPLQPGWIIVQNNEIKEWLSLQFAQQNDIAGNFRFIFPSEFMWVLFRLRNSTIPDVLPGDLNSMVWVLFELISSKPDWLTNLKGLNVDFDSPKKVFQFSSQLADLFDQYQVYRPDMMENWLQGNFSATSKDEVWQSAIWRQLNKVWGNSNRTANLPRRSEAHSQILKWIDVQNQEFCSGLPQNIYVFGLSNISRPFSEVITKLSQIADIHYYLNNPGVSDENSENKTVYSGWMKPFQQQQSLIESGLKEFNLQQKSELLNEGIHTKLPDIKLHSCHNPRREVQVLKDEILRFLDNHPEKKPSDILVMVTDPEKYAGIIQSVFKNENSTELLFSGIRLGGNESAEHTISELLSLLNSSFKADRLLQFMHLNSIKRSFDFKESDLNTIEEWVVSNKIHFGLGNKFNDANSWLKGLNQLITGFTIEVDELEIYEGLIPDDSVSSSEQAELMAKFSRFIHEISWANNEVQESKSVQSWMEFTEEATHRFISVKYSEQILKKLSKLKVQAQFSSGKQVINFDLFKSWLLNLLNDLSASSGRFGNGITISSYVPYRSVPFHFVAMLGMNEGTFPRKAIRPDFDLIYANPIPGDRILMEDDTYLFLETIQAAGSHLHLSYVGADQNTDARKLPSILIQQLTELRGEPYENAAIQHRLHPFNKLYFDEEVVRSYSKNDFKVALNISENSSPKIPLFYDGKVKISSAEEDVIMIHDIISFFTHPCKYMAERVLDIKNYDRFKEIESRELFTLKGLDRYKLDDLLFKRMAENQETEHVFDYVQTGGMIPAALPGEKLFNREKQSMELLVKSLNKKVSEQPESVEINFKYGGTQVIGNIKGVCGNMFISHRVGQRRAKHEIEHWIKHVLLVKNGVDIEKSIYLSVKDNKVDTLILNSENISDSLFNELFTWFNPEKLDKDKLAFFPESSKAYTKEFSESGNREEAVSKAVKEWEPNDYGPDESTDYYNKLIWRYEKPLASDVFHENALMFWVPFLDSVEERK